MSGRVLVVDDEEGIRAFIREVLEGEGLEVVEAGDGLEAVGCLEKSSFHLLLTDLQMPRLDGLGLLAKAREMMPEMEVVMLTAHGSVEAAVKAMKLGAYDFLTKPLSGPAELRLLVGRALERRRLRQAQPAAGTGARMIAEDPKSIAVLAQIDKVAPTNATVLLLGESGTGKEIAARVIHDRSGRRDGPFVAVNCAAVATELVESEMFGHEKGAFTGASERRQGRFELADGGTLFLDEVAELPAALQAKLLRVLQERSFERVGGTREIKVDVRLIAATNRELEIEIRDGRFREDLYHRLAVFPLELPPLRARPQDILPIAEHLLGRIGRELRVAALRLEPAARERLLSHGWPGNVRELGNALERAAILSGGPTIGAEHVLLGRAGGGRRDAVAAAQVDGTLRDLERDAIRRALEACGGHRKNAAERLGIGLRTLYDKIKEYEL